MKIAISHRGNTDGPIEDLENSPSYILKTLDLGLCVETDVWYIDNQWYLGHDSPQYQTNIEFLNRDRLILHAKNLAALYELTIMKEQLHYFWHENDDFTLTSRGMIWTYPNKEVTNRSIIVCTSKEDALVYKEKSCFGICTDYITSVVES